MPTKSLWLSFGRVAVLATVVSTSQAQNPNKITKCESFDTLYSSQTNGWVEMGSRADGHNFGFSNTSYAGGTNGEAGGIFRHGGTRVFYGDVFGANFGTLGFNDTLTATGRVVTMSSASTDRALVTLGWNSSTNVDLQNEYNLMCMIITEGTRVDGHIQFADGINKKELFGIYTLTPGTPYRFSLNYDPNGGTGSGNFNIQIWNSNGTILHVSTNMILSASERSRGIALDSFGWGNRGMASGTKLSTNYMDEVCYSALPGYPCAVRIQAPKSTVVLGDCNYVTVSVPPPALNAGEVTVGIASANPAVATPAYSTVIFPQGGSYFSANVRLNSSSPGSALLYLTNLSGSGVCLKTGSNTVVTVAAAELMKVDVGSGPLQSGWFSMPSCGTYNNVNGSGINVTLATGGGTCESRNPGGSGALADVEADLLFANNQTTSPNSDFIVTLSGLAPGVRYKLRSYHHRNGEADTIIPNVTVTGASDVIKPASITQGHAIMDSPAEILFTAGAGNVVVRYQGPAGGCAGCQVFLNGFTLELGAATVQFASVASAGLEDVSPVELNVVMSMVLTQAVSMAYEVSGTATGGGVDYALASGTLTFNPGETNKTISIQINNDGLNENDETIVVTLTALGTGIVGSGRPALGIRQSGGGVTLSWSEAEVGYQLESRADLVNAPGWAAVTNGVAVSNGLRHVTMSLGSQGRFFRLWGVGEQGCGSSVVRLGSQTTHTYTILDPRPAVQFATPASNGSEAATPASVRVVISPGLISTGTVDFAVTGGTATGGGVDYTLANGTLTFAPGETEKFISFAITNDALEEFPDETIVLTLSNPNASVKLGGIAQHTFTILDDELGPVRINSLGMEFVRITPGSFTMGVNTDLKLPNINDPDFDEWPAHTVTLTKQFYMLKTKVAQSHYAQAGLAGSATDVNWNNAAAFCAWLSQQEGRTYRLPTEAEWEYVYENPQSVLNMSGREWVQDWHQIYLNDSLTNPVGPSTGILKVIRTDGQNRLSLSPDATSSPWGFPSTGFRVVLDFDPATNAHVTPAPFNQCALKQGTAVALQGPNTNVPYYMVRFALPLPPDNDTDQNGPLTGLDQGAVDHNHSPGFEVMPNGDALAVWFSGWDGSEYGPEVRIVQARLRYGAEEFDMPETLYKIKGYNDESPCLWREGTTNWLFVGGRMDLDNVPFKVAISTDSGATWRMWLPYLTGSRGAFTAQPITSAFRAPGGAAIYLASDGGGTDSFLWRSLDNGITWNDQMGRTGGRHSTILPLDGSGNLVSYGGKNSDVNGYMPKQTSGNWGSSWSGTSQSPFPALSSNQRPSLWRLANGHLVMVGDSQLKGTTSPPGGWCCGSGCYVAISTNNGSNWRIKALPTALPHETDNQAGTLGYATVRQSPNGIIHVLSTMTHPCIHYEFNEAWVYSNDGDTNPETTGGTVQSYSENYPGGVLRATWSARICPNGRYLLDGLETTYYANGQNEREVTWASGRRTGAETYWGQDGTKLISWEHNPGANTAKWIHWWSNGRKRVESNWNTYPRARDRERNFRGLVANGPAYHWNRDGTGRATYNFNNGSLSGTGSPPPSQP